MTDRAAAQVNGSGRYVDVIGGLGHMLTCSACVDSRVVGWGDDWAMTDSRVLGGTVRAR